jgi:hypothetical protein
LTTIFISSIINTYVIDLMATTPGHRVQTILLNKGEYYEQSNRNRSWNYK